MSAIIGDVFILTTAERSDFLSIGSIQEMVDDFNYNFECQE